MTLAISSMTGHQYSSASMDKMIEDLRNPELQMFTEVRTHIISIMMEYMKSNGFLHPPIYIFSTLTDPLNHETFPAKISYYGKELSLIQSLIFHKMIIVSLSDIQKVFWLSPNIRLESSENGEKYATEFTQMDFEARNWKYIDAISFVDNLLKTIKNKLPHRIKSYESVTLLTNLKREAYDYYCDKIQSYKNFDFEINGIEVCSGAQREYEYERLKARMEELDYPLAYFTPVLELAERQLLKPSAGAGIGVERLTQAMLGIEDISKIYPFKRRPKENFLL